MSEAVRSDEYTPFGLPMGSVRALMSLLICAFFWITLLRPGEDEAVKPLLGHFFMLALVLLAFSSSTSGNNSPFLPWLLRVLFVGGTVGVVTFTAIQHPERLSLRLTPSEVEFKNWWSIFLGTTAGAFAFGIVLRRLLGPSSHMFQSLRAWLSVVGMVMMTLEMGLVLASGTGKTDDFLRGWQIGELAIVAAYFGSRI